MTADNIRVTHRHNKDRTLMNYRLLLLFATLTASARHGANAQERTSSAMYLQPQAKADVDLFYSVGGEGTRHQPTWGLDLQWINEQNLRKGVRHMGRENVGIGRSGFRATAALANDATLGSDQTDKLRERSNLFTTVCGATLPVVLTADQEAGADSYYVTNKSCNTSHWAAMINAHVEWMQKNTQHPVVGVSPYNEPDYWTVEEGATAAKQAEVARMLRQDYSDTMEGIAIVGGNTLNNDKALAWYQTGKQYYDWGNTHQLAGSFDTFAKFFEQLKADGKTGYADEMHNVGEAMAGLEYGMTVGVWWGFDSRARGEFCDISRHGERLAYGEHRANWTAAAVYRHDDGRVKAFMGSSERQALATTYRFVSKDRDVYYDTQGPMREFSMEMPGGTAYQTGQTNAERVIDILYGEDVPHVAVSDGTYRLVNKATGTYLNGTASAIVMQQNYIKSQTQQWKVKRIDSRIGGDYSFYDIEQVKNAHMHINVQNFSTLDGAKVIPYTANTTPDSNEQWYFQYAGDGFFYIRNRETSLCLTTASAAASNGVAVQTNELQTDSAMRERQMWRLIPAGIVYDKVAPAKPEGLEAKAQTASVLLTWQANNDSDIRGYNIFRKEASTANASWNVIARDIKTQCYVDNNCRPGCTYIYNVKALDQSLNLSEASTAAEATPGTAKAMTARWTFDGTLRDNTENMMDAALWGDTVYATGREEGTKAFWLNAKRYMQLPHEVATHHEMTFCAWVKSLSSSAWQRIFDFGNGTSHYMFLTPTNGSVMRFAIKNGGEEQTVDCTAKLPTNQWKHVAVTVCDGKTAIYIDGEEVAASTDITIRPSDIRPALNYLGRSQFSADPYFVGYISDARVYNHALTAEGVRRAMNGETDDDRGRGDVNGDGVVDVADIAAIISIMAGSEDGSNDNADVNGDGTVDVADIATVIHIMAQ